MSASREKKERQGVAAQNLTQRQMKEAKEAGAAKRKSTIYWGLGIVLALLVAALLAWDSGFFQSRAVAATVSSEKLSMGEMQYYYGMVRNSELDQQKTYAQYGISVLSDPYAPYNFDSAEGDKQVYNKETNQTYAEHFRERALETAKEIAALTGAAKEEGYTLSPEGRQAMQDGLKKLKSDVKLGGWGSFNSYLGRAFGKFVNTGVYTAAQEKAALASEYQTQKSDSLTYNTKQLTDYAAENPALLQSYDYRYAYISGTPETKTDADGKTIEATDEEKAEATKAAKDKADAIIKGVQDAVADKKSTAFADLVKEALGADSSYAKDENSLRTNVLGSQVQQEGSGYFSWMTDAARKPGDVTAISSGSGYYVVLFLGAELSDEATVDVRHILITAEALVDDPATADVDESKNAPTQEALDAAKSKAQGLLDEFNGLPENKRTAETFGRMANENSEDTGSNTTGGLYSYVEKGTMVPEFDTWIFDSARKSGDTGLVSNVAEGSYYYGYHVMYFVGHSGPKWHELAQSALRSGDMTKWLDALKEPYTAEWTAAGSANIA